MIMRDHTLIRVTRVINLLHASIAFLMSLFFDGKYSSYMLIRQMCVRYNMKKYSFSQAFPVDLQFML